MTKLTPKQAELVKEALAIQSEILGISNGRTKGKERRMDAVLTKLGFDIQAKENEAIYKV